MKAVVFGGGGFLGSAIVRKLAARGDTVIAAGRSRYPHLEREGIETTKVDIRNADSVTSICKGMDTVFHTAALAAIWGPRQSFWDINVKGTRNVIQACRQNGVPRLVFTSSPSVIFGEDDLCNVNESVPYPDRYLAHYPETKAVAEREVLAANDANLATVALRPHLIWGPGDPHLIPRIIERARHGKLMQVGDGTNLVDIVYIDNAAQAHLDAADRLQTAAQCAGKAYFISQGQPVALWPWLKALLQNVNAPAITRSISYNTARRAGAVLETVYRLLNRKSEPRMTRFLAAQLAKSHYFDIQAARQELGYHPQISETEGMEQLLRWLRDGK